MTKYNQVYAHINELPIGMASGQLTPGCLVMEGGAWRGLYSQGVVDKLMEQNINLQDVIGVSAGAMAAMNYVSGQIGRSIRINLAYRHNSNYVGTGALKHDHGVTGFSFLWNEISDDYPLNAERFDNPARQFTAVATDIETASPAYFEKGKYDMEKAVQASATVPYISKPVQINGRLYLDGGISDPIPYEHALQKGYGKIVVIRTRDRQYRKEGNSPEALIRAEYRKYPKLMQIMSENTERYNNIVENLNALEEEGKLFVIAPSVPLTIPRFEGDLDKLAEVYWQGYHDAENSLEALKEYLGK